MPRSILRLLPAAAVFLIGLAPLQAAPPASIPWQEGETLDYRIRWGPILAAEAGFTARQPVPGQWRFSLNLKSRGVVDTLSPISDSISSVTEIAPWRSLEFDEDRSEGKEVRKRVIHVDYPHHLGRVRDSEKKDPATFPIPYDAVDDLGSMLYSLRRVDWKPGTTVPLRAYDGPVLKRGEVSFLRREAIEVPAFPAAIPCLVVRMKPIYDDPAKNAQGYYVTLWISDDAHRTPLRADMKAAFGTFTLELMPSVK